ncbi:MAG: T9SS type A sorting domain-containing protein [Candidatus Eisenbacteria bacterium]|nr:T9SS type A sorting domain-containing protein [Candidatus Eisenbacteria bacterium]
MIRACGILLIGCLFVCRPCVGFATPPRADSVTGGGAAAHEYLTLTVVVLDDETEEEIECRCVVVDAQSNPVYPEPAAGCFYHHPYGLTPGYFYSRGRSIMSVPAGPTSIMINRGFEFETIVDTVGVRSDTTVTYRMRRWIDMNSKGLYSGDCHTHTDHSGGVYTVEPEDAYFVARAEGLNVINCLDNGYCFTGGPDPCSTPDCIVYMAEEHRSCVYGHSDLLGISSLIIPPSTDWWPLIMDVADEVHTQVGAAIISAHPVNTSDFFDIFSTGGKMIARELPVDVVKRKIDGYELLAGQGSSLTRTRQMWYRILNCGFRLAACAGTDACLNAAYGKPPGCYRVYVQVPGAFDYDTWLASMIAGRTFVTNGPLFTQFEVRNFSLGDSVSLTTTGVAHLDGRVRVECETPLTRVDIICNGHIDQTFYAGEGECVIDRQFLVTVDESSWIAARASGPMKSPMTAGDSLFAQSGPVYFTMNGVRILDIDSAQEMVDWVSDFQRLASMYGEWIVPGQGVRLLQELAAARAYYEALAAGAATGAADGQSQEPPGELALFPCRPNPFRDGTSLEFMLEREGHVSLGVYTPSGRLVRTLADCTMAAGAQNTFWNGCSSDGLPCPSGVYFCKLTADGRTITRRIALIR